MRFLPSRPHKQTRSHVARWLLALGALSFAASFGASCSLVIDGNADSCTADADCVNHPGRTLCDAESGTCISADTCTSNGECGAGEVCTVSTPRSCQPISQGNCTQVIPDDETYKDDSALLIGLSAPLTEGGNPSSTGVSILHSAQLALEEINESGGANGERKLVLVACDDTGERTLAEDNGQTLAKIGVQAIVGPAFSGQTLDMTKGPNYDKVGTVALGVLNISSSATSTEITGIVDKAPSCAESTPEDCPGLVWRTSPSDLYQGAAMVKYFPQLEAIALNRVTPARTNVKVVILHKGDPYGKNLAKFVSENLLVNGTVAINSPDALKLDYGDTSAGLDPDPAIIAQAIDFKADIYIAIGTNELGTALATTEVPDPPPGVLQTIEENWADATTGSEPYYLLADGGLIREVENAAQLTGSRLRVRGTVPGTIATSPFDTIALFTGRYQSRFPDDDGGPEIFGAAGAYDAMYLLAYSVAAGNGSTMTGEQFARGLLRVSDLDSDQLEVGQDKFGTGNNTLQNGGTIDFVGASGPLDFDPVSGEAISDIQIWCIDSGNKGGFSALYYDAESDAMSGNDDVAGECPFPEI